jgi:hypothetical protein
MKFLRNLYRHELTWRRLTTQKIQRIRSAEIQRMNLRISTKIHTALATCTREVQA